MTPDHEIETAAAMLEYDHPSKSRLMRELLAERQQRRRYALFVGLDYYPDGGWGDFAGCHDDMDPLVASFKPESCEWAHIVDMRSGRVVLESKDGAPWDYPVDHPDKQFSDHIRSLSDTIFTTGK